MLCPYAYVNTTGAQVKTRSQCFVIFLLFIQDWQASNTGWIYQNDAKFFTVILEY
jgi:hypothetical protein